MQVSGQTIDQQIDKSDLIQNYNGKDFYLHEVEAGQTVYAIARAYEVSQTEIFNENPDSRSGLRIGQILRIPVISKETEIRQDLNQTDFDFFYHIVAKGETYYGISRKYNVDLSLLQQANRETEGQLKEGQYLKIPILQATPFQHTTKDTLFRFIPVIGDYHHLIKAGEDWKTIAQNYQVKEEDLRQVNPGIPGSLRAGDSLFIPTYGIIPPQIDYITHTVKRKETLYSISRQYGVPLNEIYRENPGLSSEIREGQKITIPRQAIEKPYILHKVREKTKLKKLAKEYGITRDDLLELDPFLPKWLEAGMAVKIPVGRFAEIETSKPRGTDSVRLEEITPKVIVPYPCNAVKKHTDKVFRIALMVPLYLEEVPLMSLTQETYYEDFAKNKAFRFIQYYEGALLALESLKAQGMNIELFVYDADQHITKTTEILQRAEMKTMDLIIGPFFSKSFTQVANFGKLFDIMVVNPLSPRDEIVSSYPNVVKWKPSQSSQFAYLSQLIADQYSRAKVFIVHPNDYTDAEAFERIKEKIMPVIAPYDKVPNYRIYNKIIELDERAKDELKGSALRNFRELQAAKGSDISLIHQILSDGIIFEEDSLSLKLDDSTAVSNQPHMVNFAADSLQPIFDHGSMVRQNLVVTFSEDIVFVMELINELHKIRQDYPMVLVGMPEWNNFDKLEVESLVDLQVIQFEASFSDYVRDEVDEFVGDFRDRFQTEPNNYAFDGYETLMFFGSMLLDFGPNFTPCMENRQSTSLGGPVHFQQPNKTDGFINTYWNIIQYRGFQKILLNAED